MITRVLQAVPLVFAAWVAVLAGVMLVSDKAPAAVVMFPSDGFIAALPKGVAIIDANALSVTVASEVEGFGLVLYRAGARLVLPAGLIGCLPLSRVKTGSEV